MIYEFAGERGKGKGEGRQGPQGECESVRQGGEGTIGRSLESECEIETNWVRVVAWSGGNWERKEIVRDRDEDKICAFLILPLVR